MPFARGNQIFTTRTAGEGKAVFCIQDGPNGKPEVLLDSVQDPYLPKYPLDGFSLSNDGRYLVYFVPQIPHRFEEIRVVDVRTHQLLPDVIQWTYLSDLAWDGNGFYYGKYPKPSDLSAPDFKATDHLNERIYYHRLGTPPDSDEIVFEDPAHPRQKYLYLEGFDHRWFHIHFMDPTDFFASSEWFCRTGKGKLNLTAIQPEIATGRFWLCDDIADKFLIFTNYRAPMGRVILIDPKVPSEANWKTVIPEGQEHLTDGESSAGKLLLVYELATGGHRLEIRSQLGKPESSLLFEPGTSLDVQWSAPAEKRFFFSTKNGSESKKYYLYTLKAKSFVPFN